MVHNKLRLDFVVPDVNNCNRGSTSENASNFSCYSHHNLCYAAANTPDPTRFNMNL